MYVCGGLAATLLGVSCARVFRVAFVPAHPHVSTSTYIDIPRRERHWLSQLSPATPTTRSRVLAHSDDRDAFLTNTPTPASARPRSSERRRDQTAAAPRSRGAAHNHGNTAARRTPHATHTRHATRDINTTRARSTRTTHPRARRHRRKDSRTTVM
eukprot:scaffold4720_cov106-Isochrysis_galbana.AAC.2